MEVGWLHLVIGAGVRPTPRDNNTCPAATGGRAREYRAERSGRAHVRTCPWVGPETRSRLPLTNRVANCVTIMATAKGRRWTARAVQRPVGARRSVTTSSSCDTVELSRFNQARLKWWPSEAVPPIELWDLANRVLTTVPETRRRSWIPARHRVPSWPLRRPMVD